MYLPTRVVALRPRAARGTRGYARAPAVLLVLACAGADMQIAEAAA